MQSLHILIERWKAQGVTLLPPQENAAVRGVFAKLGSFATRDVLDMYSAVGGMASMDEEYWCLWSLADVQTENEKGTRTGVLFSDFLVSCWCYRLVPNDEDTSAVFVDYGGSYQPIKIANSVEKFFDIYLANPNQVLLDEGVSDLA